MNRHIAKLWQSCENNCDIRLEHKFPTITLIHTRKWSKKAGTVWEISNSTLLTHSRPPPSSLAHNTLFSVSHRIDTTQHNTNPTLSDCLNCYHFSYDLSSRSITPRVFTNSINQSITHTHINHIPIYTHICMNVYLKLLLIFHFHFCCWCRNGQKLRGISGAIFGDFDLRSRFDLSANLRFSPICGLGALLSHRWLFRKVNSTLN